MIEPTPFQTSARAEVEAFFSRCGIPVFALDELVAHMPHMDAPELAIRIRYEGGEVWLYANEATFSWMEQDIRLEREDFASLDSLRRALMKGLETRVRRPPG